MVGKPFQLLVVALAVAPWPSRAETLLVKPGKKPIVVAEPPPKAVLIQTHNGKAVVVNEAKGAARGEKPARIGIGDSFELKSAIQAILLESGETFNADGGGLRDHVVELIDNSKEEALAQCKFTTAQPKLREKPCAFGNLVVLKEHVGANQAPRIGTCFCTSTTNLSSQPRIVTPKIPLAADEPVDPELANFKPDEEEPMGEYIEDEIEVPDIATPDAPVLAAKGLAVYRSNGTLAKGYENLQVEVVRKQPVVNADGTTTYLARLWKKNEYGDLEPFNHRSIYGVTLNKAQLAGHSPQSDLPLQEVPQVFRRLAAIKVAPATKPGTTSVTVGRPPSDRQRKLIQSAISGSAGRSLGLCATYVKKAIEKAYGIRYTKCDAFEMDLTYDLEANGFEKLDIIDPTKAPPGAIILYDSFAKRGTYKTRPKGRSGDEMRVDFPAGIGRKGYVPYYGHVEVATGDPAMPFVSDFQQKNSVIAHSTKKDLAQGWGYNRTRSREYQVIGIYYKR